MKLKGLTLAALFFVGTLMAPIQFSYSEGSQSSQSKTSASLASITPFSAGVVLISSGSTAGEILQMMLDELVAEDVTNLGMSVSEAAKLHQLLYDATKEERNHFKMLFHEYKAAVKAILEIGQGNTDRELNHFSKQAIKLEKTIEKLEAKDELKDKIKNELKTSQLQRELQRLKNHIGTLETLLADGPEKDKTLAELNELKEESYRNILLLKATKNGKDLTDEDLQKIEDKVDKKINSKSGHKKDKDDNVSSSDEKQGKDNKGKDKGKKDNKGKSKGGKK
jgi:hypothetical protein